MSEKRYAVCRERDEQDNWIVIATITNGSDEYGQHPLPKGFHCIELPAEHKKGDVLPGDVWNEHGRAFEMRSDQRAALIAEQASDGRARV